MAVPPTNVCISSIHLAPIGSKAGDGKQKRWQGYTGLMEAYVTTAIFLDLPRRSLRSESEIFGIVFWAGANVAVLFTCGIVADTPPSPPTQCIKARRRKHDLPSISLMAPKLA